MAAFYFFAFLASTTAKKGLTEKHQEIGQVFPFK